jgi:hypothetical protein
LSPARDAEVDALIRAAAEEGLQEGVEAKGVERPQKKQKREMDEDGEDEGENGEREEEENTQDLTLEPEKEEATEPASPAGDASVDERPTPTMKRPAGAGTTGKLGKGKGNSKSKKPTSIPKPGKGKQGKGKAEQGKGKRSQGASENLELHTPPAKKSRPEEILNHDDWFASEEKRLQTEIEQAQQCWYNIRFA